MKFRLETKLPAPPSRIWERLQQYDTLAYLMRGLLGFSGSRPAQMKEGDRLALRLYFFNLIPGWRHFLHIVSVDEKKRKILTKERGGWITRWEHVLSIEETADGKTLYSDELDIAAGPFTIPVYFFARTLYAYRHYRWRRLAKRL